MELMAFYMLIPPQISHYFTEDKYPMNGQTTFIVINPALLIQNLKNKKMRF